MNRIPEGTLTRAARAGDIQDVEGHFSVASVASNDCLWEWDLLTGEVRRSAAMATRFGYVADDIEPNTDWWRSRVHPDDRERICAGIDRAIAEATEASWTGEYRFQRADGTYAEVCDRAYLLKDAGVVCRAVGAVMDVSEMKTVSRALQESEARYRHTIEVTGQIAWSADPEGMQFVFSEPWRDLTGLDCSLGLEDWALIADPADLPGGREQWRQSIESGQALDVEHRMKIADGSVRWFRTRAAPWKDENGEVERWYGTIEDIHDRKLNELALLHLANFDELTSLRNRHCFAAHLEARLKAAAAQGLNFGLLVLDIDDFKSVNDLFGHSAGDLLLREFAARTMDAGLQLYRLGGDEFALLVEDGDEAGLLTAADELHHVLSRPFRLAETVMTSRASVGCALFPVHGNTPSELLKSADIALYASKAAGRGQTRLFASAMRSNIQKRISMLEVARRALDAGEIRAFFQPKISLHNGSLVGFEALMRISSERFGPLQPAIVAAAFEHPELALQIADRVFGEVATVVKRWRAKGLEFGRVAINASSLEFSERNYAAWILSRIDACGISGKDIEVEVTETVFLGGPEHSVLESLHQVKEAGITIALDDFGTGFASLSHLRQYPVNVLKIDQSFVRDIGSDRRQQQITRALIELSRTMNIQTVAEGVETAGQVALLRSFGCDVGQGFHFGKAMSATAAEAFLQSKITKFRQSIQKELGRS